MQAIPFSSFGGSEVLDYLSVPNPSPKSDEVLIEVTAAGVNFPDIRERMGVYTHMPTCESRLEWRSICARDAGPRLRIRPWSSLPAFATRTGGACLLRWE